MLSKFQYSTPAERENIITEHSTLILVEEHNITEGNFLIFSDVALEPEIVYVSVPQDDFTNLKSRLTATEEALLSLLLEGGA